MYRIEWGSTAPGVSVRARSSQSALRLARKYLDAGHINVVITRTKDRRQVSIVELETTCSQSGAAGVARRQTTPDR
jgi:hypothetical protein